MSHFQKHSGNLNQNPPFKGKSDNCMGSLSTHAKQQLGKAGVSAFYFSVCGYDSGKCALSLAFKGKILQIISGWLLAFATHLHP